MNCMQKLLVSWGIATANSCLVVSEFLVKCNKLMFESSLGMCQNISNMTVGTFHFVNPILHRSASGRLLLLPHASASGRFYCTLHRSALGHLYLLLHASACGCLHFQTQIKQRFKIQLTSILVNP